MTAFEQRNGGKRVKTRREYIPAGCDEQGRQKDGVFVEYEIDPFPLIGLVVVIGSFALTALALWSIFS